ncbi:MAG TPA: HEAT repeat domain-containing protein [Ktedonobacteraceae bacterium]
MPGTSTATIDILKALTNVSFSCLSAIFGAAGNVPLAGMTMLPPAVLTAYETLHENIRTGKQKDRLLRVPLPPASQWSGSPAEWQTLCGMIEQRLPDMLERMHTHLAQVQGFLSQEYVRQAFIEALVAEPWPVLVDTPTKRRQVGEIVAAPVLAHLAYILAPVIQQLRQEHAWADTSASRNVLEALKDRFAPPPLSRQELSRVSKRYRTALHSQWKMLDFRGMIHVEMNRPLSIPLGDVFILPDVLVGFPDESETFERDTIREKDPAAARKSKDENSRFEREPEERRLRQSARARTILQRTDLSPILARQKRLVILGDPGSGKSTLLRYLLLQLTATHPQMLQTQPTLAKALSRLHPVYLPLATYAADWASQPVGERSLLDFLPRYLQDQLLGDYREALLFHLSQGTLLFLLDGLDEIPDTSLRVQIVKAIETLTLSFPKNRFIVTSRIVGYKDVPLAAGYEPYTLADFTREQIRSFAYIWTPAYERWVQQTSTDQSPQATAREAEKLFQATQRNAGVRRLAVNPLLLTILALIQRQGIELPSHRIELYDRCATTLLDAWIKAKGVQTSADFDRKTLFKILCPLAFWMHEHPSVGAIPEEELLAQVAQLVDRRVIRTQEDAARFAEAFLQTVRSQTGMIVERGKERYGFLHLTFEEYFAACELVLRDDRDVFIKTHLHNPRWREVILLAVGTIGILQYNEREVTRLLQEAILGAQSPFENRLHRDLILAGICLADDIGVSAACEEDIMERIVFLFLTTPYQTLRESMTAVFQAWRDTPLARRCLDLFALLLQKYLSASSNTIPQMTPASLSGTQFQTKVEEYISQLQQWSRTARTQLVQIALLALLPETKVHLDQLLEMVDQVRSSPDFDVRQAAAAALGHLGCTDPRVLDALLIFLSDSDWRVREAAAAALGHLGSTDPRVLDALLTSLSASDSRVRQASAAALGHLGSTDPRVLDALLTSFSDSYPRVREATAAALGHLGSADPRVLDALLTSLSDSDFGVRQTAAAALGHLGSTDPRVLDALLTSLSDSDWQMRQAAIAALGHLGSADPRVLDALLTSLSDSDSRVRRAAATALGHLGSADPRVLDALLSSLSASDSRVRLAGASALGNLGCTDPRVLDALLASLSDSDSDPFRFVHRAAAAALGHLGSADPRVLDALLASLSDSDWQMRQAAVAALGRLGSADPRVLDALLASLFDSYSRVREAAATALGHLGSADPRVLDALLASLSDSDWQMRQAAATALGNLIFIDPGIVLILQKKHSSVSIVDFSYFYLILEKEIRKKILGRIFLSAQELGSADLRVLDTLLTSLSDSDSDFGVRRAAATALGNLGSTDSRILDALLASLSDSDFGVRRAAASALGHLGSADPRVLDALLASLSDSDSRVRRAAASALGHLGSADPRVLDALLTSLSNPFRLVRQTAATALGHLGSADSRVLNALLTSLFDSDWQMREAAATALGHLGNADPRILDALLTSLFDSDWQMREAAATALDHLGCTDSRILDALLTSLSDSDSDPFRLVRRAAASALGNLGSADPRVLDALLTSLFDSDWQMREAAAAAFGHLGSTDPRVLDALLTSLSDSDSRVRQAAASALGQIDNRQTLAIPALTPLLVDFVPDIQRTAIATLLKFPDAHLHETILFIESILQRYDRQTDRQIEADEHVDTLLFVLQQLAGKREASVNNKREQAGQSVG